MFPFVSSLNVVDITIDFSTHFPPIDNVLCYVELYTLSMYSVVIFFITVRERTAFPLYMTSKTVTVLLMERNILMLNTDNAENWNSV